VTGDIIMEQGADDCTVTKAADATVSAPEGYYWKSGEGNVATLAEAVAQVGDEKYDSIEDAIAAVTAENSTVKLLKDVTQSWLNINNGKTFTLDLNDKTLTANIDLYSGFMTVANGTVKGTVYVNGGAANDPTPYNSFTVASGATIDSTYAIILYQSSDGNTAYGSTINVAGTLEGNLWVMGNIKEGNSVINVTGKVDATDKSDIGIAVNGNATVNLNGATVMASKNGSGTAVEVRAGILNVTDSTLTGCGEYSVVPNGSGSTTTGAALAIAQHTTNLLINVTVTDSTLSGTTALSIANPQKNTADLAASVTVQNSTLTPAEGNSAVTFNANDGVAETRYGVKMDETTANAASVPSGYELVKNEETGEYKLNFMKSVIYGAGLTLEGMIGINFSLTEIDPHVKQIRFTQTKADGTTVTKTIGVSEFYKTNVTTGIAGVTATQYAYYVAAKEMADVVTMELLDEKGDNLPIVKYSDGSIVPGGKYQYWVNKYTVAAGSEELVKLVDAMKEYGAYARYFFGNDSVKAETELPNTDLSVVTSNSEILKDAAVQKTGECNTGLRYYGSTVNLSSGTGIKLYFELIAGAIGEHGFELSRDGGETFETVTVKHNSGRFYEVDIDNIAAKNLDDTFVVRVDGSFVIHYSVLSYVLKNLNAGDINLQNVVKALYLYNVAANGYFGK